MNPSGTIPAPPWTPMPPKPGELRAIKPPAGFTYYQFVAVHLNTQNLIFSNNGTDWVSYDGLPVR